MIHYGITHAEKDDTKADPVHTLQGMAELEQWKLKIRESAKPFLENRKNISIVSGTGLRFRTVAHMLLLAFGNDRPTPYKQPIVYDDLLGTDTSFVSISDPLTGERQDVVYIGDKFKTPEIHYIKKVEHFPPHIAWKYIVIPIIRRCKRGRGGAVILSTGRELLRSLGYQGKTSNALFALDTRGKTVTPLLDGVIMRKT